MSLRGLVVLAVFFATRTAFARDVLDDVESSKRLVWGADQEGGGPYVFPLESDATKTTGFEVDLAKLLADDLGAEPQFFQGDWTKLPDLLRIKKIHVVMNGYEWSPARAESMEASIPYYVYALQLLARRDDATIASVEDLAPRGMPESAPKKRVGVLAGSAAHTYLSTRFGERIELALYDGNTDAMREVETQKLDAALEDTPIASFYAPRFPRLHAVGEAVGKGTYVLFAQKGEKRLVRALNRAIVRGIESGAIERIDRAYGIWDERQLELRTIAKNARFFGVATDIPSPEDVNEGARRENGGSSDSKTSREVVPAKLGAPTSTVATSPARGLSIVKNYGGILLQAALVTIGLACASFPIALALGMLIALGRVYGPKSLRAPLAAYVEIIRGTPLLLQLYFIFFLLPEVGVRVPAIATAIIGLAVNYSAYEAEIYRAGLLAVPPGQLEAALSLGMPRTLAIRRVIAPQAFRLVIPPVVNDFIALFKDTSLCSVVTVVELTKRYSILSMSTQATLELMSCTAALYLLMSYPLSILARRLERHLALGERS